MRTRALAVLILALGSLAGGATAQVPVEVVLEPRPQSYADTCQSYGMAMAAASVPGTILPAKNATELRATELNIRVARDEVVKESKGKWERTSHEAWPGAIERASGNKLTLKLEYVKTEEDFYKRVEALTGNSMPYELPTVFAASFVKTPVLTSVNEVGANKYATGHIVTVFGLLRPPAKPKSPEPTPALAILNPAIKVGQPVRLKMVCEMGDLPGDNKYGVAATVEKDYKLRRFPGGFLVATVTKKSQ